MRRLWMARDASLSWPSGREVCSSDRHATGQRSEKVRIVEETFEPGMTVSLVARRHGVAPNQLFTWRRLVAQGALTAAGSGDESAVVSWSSGRPRATCWRYQSPETRQRLFGISKSGCLMPMREVDRTGVEPAAGKIRGVVSTGRRNTYLEQKR